ncbi:hypothetical protein ACIGT4_09205 [Streptomyces sioyaensis]|uniref:hypothetical protein n=1 Tax=Streptomyces sioyaensis TaxID=67364 RepID=UPI0037CE033E
MTTPSSTYLPAPNGWRIALGDPENRDMTLVPVIAWQSVDQKAESSIDGSPLEPVVLFDNTKEPIISTVLESLGGWPEGSYVHQVLAPGTELRDVPDGWTVIDPYQG